MSDESEETEWPQPRGNPFFVGHDAAEMALLDAWKSERFPHAWLLSGAKGVGKATLAYRFARFVLSGGESVDQGGLFGDVERNAVAVLNVDENHPVFHRVAAAGHADLMTVRRTLNPDTKKIRRDIVVADIRTAGRSLRLTPGEAGWRIVIVDCADEMNPSAANAILKMLEEPPPRTVFFLLSHAPGRLLPTIRSRCRRLRLDALDENTMTLLLERYRPDLSDAERQILGALSEGSIGAALRLELDGGLALHTEIIDLLAGLRDFDVAKAHALGDKLARSGGFETFVWLLSGWAGRLIGGVARGGAGLERVPGEARAMAVLYPTANLAQLMEVWDKVSELLTRADRSSLDHKQVVVSAFLSLQTVAITNQ